MQPWLYSAGGPLAHIMSGAGGAGGAASLPDELVGVVASFLPLRDVLACRLVCSRWAACIDAAPAVWKELFLSAFVTRSASQLVRSPHYPAAPVTPTAAEAAEADATTAHSFVLDVHSGPTGHDGDGAAGSAISCAVATNAPPKNKKAAAAATTTTTTTTLVCSGYRGAFLAKCKLIARWRADRPWEESLDPPLRYEQLDSTAAAPHRTEASTHNDASAYRALIGVNGSVLVTAHGEGSVRMHNLEASGLTDSSAGPRTVIARHSEHAGAAASVAVVSLAAPDGVDGGDDGPAHVWTGGMDASVCVWNLKSRTRVARIADAHPSPVLCMHGCDGAVITGSLCGSVRLWKGPSLAESTIHREVRACVQSTRVFCSSGCNMFCVCS